MVLQCALKQTSFKPHTNNFANQWKAFESAKTTETPASTKSLVSERKACRDYAKAEKVSGSMRSTRTRGDVRE